MKSILHNFVSHPLGMLMLLAMAVAAPAGHAAIETCYNGELAQYRPAVQATVAVLIDTSADATAVRDSYLAAVRAAAGRPNRHVVVLTYAGHAAGEALRQEFDGVLEPPITDPAVIDSTVIRNYKLHRKCIAREQAAFAQELEAVMQRILSTMPVSTQRSEIAYATARIFDAYARPDRPLTVLHLSDGLQLSQAGRSFYGPDRQPRRIDPQVELKALLKDASTKPREQAPGTRIAVLWWGLLSMPPVGAPAKPRYLDTETLTAFVTFWDRYTRSHGATYTRFGTPSLLNPDLDAATRAAQ